MSEEWLSKCLKIPVPGLRTSCNGETVLEPEVCRCSVLNTEPLLSCLNGWSSMKKLSCLTSRKEVSLELAALVLSSSAWRLGCEAGLSPLSRRFRFAFRGEDLVGASAFSLKMSSFLVLLGGIVAGS